MTFGGVVTASNSEMALQAGNAGNVQVDIKPGSDENPINPNKGGVTPVAVLQTDDFDPSTVDVATVRFGAPDTINDSDGAAPAHDGHLEDVDGDGDVDLVLHFPTREAGFEADDTVGVLVGNTTDGAQFSGNDTVRIVGPPSNGPPGPAFDPGGR